MEECSGEYEIDHIQFGMLSTEDIIKMSTVQVTSSKITSSKSMEVGSVYDARLGTCAMTQAQRMNKCVTCNLHLKDCHGHFGYMMLNTPVTNPLCMKHILNYLKMFCFSCYRLIVTEDQLQMYGILAFSGNQRYLRVLQKIKTSDICNRCTAILRTSDASFMHQTEPGYTVSSPAPTDLVCVEHQKLRADASPRKINGHRPSHRSQPDEAKLTNGGWGEAEHPTPLHTCENGRRSRQCTLCLLQLMRAMDPHAQGVPAASMPAAS